VIRERKKEKR